MSMTAVSSRMARSKSLPSAALLARPINRLAVSLLEASQIAQMRFSIYFALSSLGARQRARRLDRLERLGINRFRRRRQRPGRREDRGRHPCEESLAHARKPSVLPARDKDKISSGHPCKHASGARTRRAQPCRALKRRWTLLIT